jgi:methionyl-tRNA formyltransferase
MNVNRKISLVIITSTALRHKFLIMSLAKKFNVLGVIQEEKKPALQTQNVPDPIVRNHFREFKEKEKEYFGKCDDLKISEEKILQAPYGQTNSQEVFEWIKNKNPDYIILYGSAIIKEPLLAEFSNRIINMHLGLSPYYRGSGANFWPLVSGEPEAVGVTIHLAVLKVDAGEILGQARPEIEISDGCHNFGCKTIIAGTELLKKIIPLMAEKKLLPQKQDLNIGRVFRVKDTTAGAIIKMRENFEKGMVDKYIKNKSERDNKFPVIEVIIRAHS